MVFLAASGVAGAGPDASGLAGVCGELDSAAAPAGAAPPSAGLMTRPRLKPAWPKPASLPGAAGDSGTGGELRNWGARLACLTRTGNPSSVTSALLTLGSASSLAGARTSGSELSSAPAGGIVRPPSEKPRA